MPGPLPIESINHLARATTRLDEMRSFYCDVLGFREISRPTFQFPGAWLYNYGLQIHLIVDESTAQQRSGPISTRADHIALHVANLDQVEALLQEKGIEFRKNYVAERNISQLFFHDPDGNHIEVGCYPPVKGAGG